MYPPIPNEYQKPTPQPSAPPYDNPPATGIPVVPLPPSSYLGVQTPQHHHPYQPQPNNFQSGSPGKWSTDLCDCSSDCSNCCFTCLCPCVTFGQVAEIVDRGSTSCVMNAVIYGLLCHFTGCACVYASCYRTKMRKQYNLPESPCADCLVHCCCECCALSQEYRHLKSQGFDLSLGWRGNMENQTHGLTMSPIVPHEMSR